MPKASRMHHGDEFGRFGSGSSTAGVDGPMIGAAAAITIDGIVERESGVTPPPPPFSMRSLVIALVVMFLVGVVGLATLRFVPDPKIQNGGETNEMIDTAP